MKGGKREGAGRKPGGIDRTKRFVTQKARAMAAAGESPLEYMLRVMRTCNDPKRKDAMAIAAAPFVHPKLAAIEHSGDKENPVAFQVVSGVPRENEKPEPALHTNGHVSAH